MCSTNTFMIIIKVYHQIMRYNVLQVHWFYLLATAFHYAMPLSHTALQTPLGRLRSIWLSYNRYLPTPPLSVQSHVPPLKVGDFYVSEWNPVPGIVWHNAHNIALLICVLFTFIYCIHWLIYGWQFSHLFNNRYHACCYFPRFLISDFWGIGAISIHCR